jgi:hypothetical protein
MHVSRRLRVFDDEDLAPLVLKNGLAVSTAEELLRAPDNDIRRRLASEAAAGNWTPAEARQAVRDSSCNDSLQRAERSPRLGSRIRALCDELAQLNSATLPRSARRELPRLLEVGRAITSAPSRHQ